MGIEPIVRFNYSALILLLVISSVGRAFRLQRKSQRFESFITNIVIHIFSSIRIEFQPSKLNVVGSNPSRCGSQNVKFTFFDSATPWQFGLQDAATPVMEGITNLHHDLMFFLVFIFFFVLVSIGWTLYSYAAQNTDSFSEPSDRGVVHGTLIEIVWTVTPSLILVIVAEGPN